MRKRTFISNQITIALYITCLCCCFSFSSFAQNNALDKANELYKDKSYAKAIPHYVKGLEDRKRFSSMVKLANCYRMTNQMALAEPILAEIVQSDKAKPKAFLDYGKTLISNGKCEEAKIWLTRYLDLEPTDKDAKERLMACDKIKDVKPYFDKVVVTAFDHNSNADDSSPIFYNNQIVFSSDRNQGTKLLKQKAGTTDRDFLKIYSSSIQNENNFSKPSSFSSKVNELNKNTANPTFWKDTVNQITEIYFVRNSFVATKKKEYNLQLFRGISSNGENWKKVEPVNFCINEQNYMHPSISPSGDTLYFVSPKGGGEGGVDIYLSTRNKRDNTWRKPVNLGSTINTSAHEGFPYAHTDGKLYFCSKGHAGFGGFDVFVTEMDKATGRWTTPINLGSPFNSAADDFSICFKKDGQSGAFTSSREGGDDDIFLFDLNPDERIMTSAVKEETNSSEEDQK